MSPLIDPRPRPVIPDNPSPTDINGIPFPGTFWALWDGDGKLFSYLKTGQRVHADWALHALGYAPPAKYTIGEFTAEKWGWFLTAVACGAPTDFATWGPGKDGWTPIGTTTGPIEWGSKP